MRSFTIGLSCIATAFAACLEAPVPDSPAARVVVTWDPLACGEPHRIVVELEHDDGAKASSSAPCWHAALELDVPRFGLYRGRIYAWVLEDTPKVRSVLPIELAVDEPVVRWIVQTPR